VGYISLYIDAPFYYFGLYTLVGSLAFMAD